MSVEGWDGNTLVAQERLVPEKVGKPHSCGLFLFGKQRIVYNETIVRRGWVISLKTSLLVITVRSE